jgi:hypothetical protein
LHLLVLAAVLSVKLVVQRSSLDLLDSLPIAVVVQNTAATPQTIRFASPAEYALELRTPAGIPLWNSSGSPLPKNVSFPAHIRTFAPGSTTLAVYDWNELLSDGTSPPAGNYVIHVRLVTEKYAMEDSVRVTFALPLSPSSLASLRINQAFTLAGSLDDQRAVLRDSRGSANLSRRLLAAPVETTVLVRGFITAKPGGARVFTVERWAAINAQPTSSP